MHNKLSREELRIIEQTKQEGEQLHASKNDVKEANGKPKIDGRRVMSYVWLVLIFIALAIVAKIFFSWMAASAQ